MRLRLFLEGKMKELHIEIIEFLKKNPKPKDKEIHALAKKLGVDPHKFEEHVYMILGDLLKKEDKIPGGKADKMTANDIADKHKVSVEKIEKQISMGVKVEMEHVDDEELAREISLDHLEEMPDYYTRLAKMEKEGGASHE
jgi:hypothetical protein